MSLALLGFVVLQAYWIRNAITLKKANFDRSVNKAATDMIYKLEKMEVADRIRQKMYHNKQGTKLFNIIDSINRAFKLEIDNRPEDSSNLTENIFNITSEKINVVVLQEHTGEIIKRYDTSVVTIQKKGNINEHWQIFSESPAFNYTMDSNSSKNIESLENKIELYLDRTHLVNDVFDDMFNLKHFDVIENRLNFLILDSMLAYELIENGINTNFEFGVYSPLRNVMVSEKTGKYHKELLEDGYAFNLFPRDLFMTPEYLMIYFPNQEQYLLSKMSWIMALSGLLFILMAGSFFYTINTIFKQKRLSEMKNDFINNMTHEFKTPISTITLACEALTDKEINASDILKENYVNMINQENKRLGSMAEKILQTALLEKNQFRLNKELIDVHKVLTDIVNNFKIQVNIKGGDISTDFKAVDSFIKADRTHFINIFYNIIDNANKYSNKKPLIKVKTLRHPKGIQIFVEDNGVGINKTNQKKIFDKLYRVHTGDIHDVKGFGLGLYYVKIITEAHGGSINVESELKKGTCIKVFLPYNH